MLTASTQKIRRKCHYRSLTKAWQEYTHLIMTRWWSARVRIWRIERILLDKGSGSSIMFSNYFKRMKLPHDAIIANIREVYGFGGSHYSLVGRVPLDITLIGKVIIVYLLLMDCNSPYHAILGRYCTIPMEVVSSWRYQCTKFPYLVRIAKVSNNQWGAHHANENSLSNQD